MERRRVAFSWKRRYTTCMINKKRNETFPPRGKRSPENRVGDTGNFTQNKGISPTTIKVIKMKALTKNAVNTAIENETTWTKIIQLVSTLENVDKAGAESLLKKGGFDKPEKAVKRSVPQKVADRLAEGKMTESELKTLLKAISGNPTRAFKTNLPMLELANKIHAKVEMEKVAGPIQS